MLPASFKSTKTTISCDPGDKKFFNNPFGAYGKMQQFEQGFFWENYNMVCFAGHEQVSQALRDRRFGRILPETDLFQDASADLKPFYRFEKNSLLEMEPPTHTRLRKAINRAFVSRNIETLRPNISQLAHELIDGFYKQKETNLLSSFAEIIPVFVIARLIGIPTNMCDQLLSWSHAMVAMYQYNRSKSIELDAVTATEEFSQFIAEIITEKSLAPSDDLISQLITKVDQGEMTSDELTTTCMLLLNAGHEATVHAIGNGVKTILELEANPSELFADAANTPAICEELLRIDPPLHLFTRKALIDLEFFGRKIKRGEEIGLLIAAANHDPKKYPQPEKFVLNRPGIAAQTGFGAGVHFCIGAPLARMEMQIALPILFERLPNLALASPPIYADRYHFHGLEALNVTW